MSTVKSLKAKTVDELCGVCTDIIVADDSLLKEFIELGEIVNKNSMIVRYGKKNIMSDTLYMDHLVFRFEQTLEPFTCHNFLLFCEKHMSDGDCAKIFDDTKEQSSNGI